MTHEDLKKWLSATHKSQAWLAKKLKVSSVTVNKWTSGRGVISHPYQVLIRQLMDQEADAPQNATESPLDALTDKELTTAAHSIGRSEKGLIYGVLGRIVNKAADMAATEQNDQ